VAARIRKELGVEVDEVPGAYGEFTVLVDGVPVRKGNRLATAFAVLPSTREILSEVRERLQPS
jgi:hypothetical protein